MKKNYLLGGLLVIQALAVYFTLSDGSKLKGHSGIQKLLEFNREQVDGIRVEDKDGNLAELKRKDSAWFTADDFPVDIDRVDSLLDRLEELEHGLAVASSSKAAKRFEVNEEKFQRHLTLLKNGKPVVEFYLGTGAGARRSHVRIADQELIYTAAIGSYDLPAEIGNWQNKDLLQIETDEVQSVEFDGLNIYRSIQSDGDADSIENADVSTWLAEGLEDDETFKADEFESQLQNLAALRYSRAFTGSIEDREIEADIIVSYGDLSRRYQFTKAAEGNDNFWLKVSDRGELFEVTQYNGNRIIDNLTKDKLIEKDDPQMEEELSTDETDASSGKNKSTL